MPTHKKTEKEDQLLNAKLNYMDYIEKEKSPKNILTKSEMTALSGISLFIEKLENDLEVPEERRFKNQLEKLQHQKLMNHL